MDHTIKETKLTNSIICFEEIEYTEHCNCYLIIGENKCLLIDLGIGFIDFSSILKKYIGDKPLITILTHFHYDHFAGGSSFKNILANKKNLSNKDIGLHYLHENDFLNPESTQKLKLAINEDKYEQVVENSIIDLGDYQFLILYTPGHDETSISLFEPRRKILFSGDLIYPGKLLASFKDSNHQQYIVSQEKIKKLQPTIIYGGHNQPITDDIPEKIDRVIKGLKEKKLEFTA